MAILDRKFSVRRRFVALALATWAVGLTPLAGAFTRPNVEMPQGFDVRMPGARVAAIPPTAAQNKALAALRARAGKAVQARYNPLTGTPRNLLRPGGYLSKPSREAPEQVARAFLASQ